ncbi:MAG: class I SAM-dependent methyltransferase, partial [Clostridia bacterium]|nr:class I SAM-dependent methyltransferase [Clostridia bacterium]
MGEGGEHGEVNGRVTLRDRLEEGARRMGLAVTPTQCEKFSQFLELLRQWNERLNLTSVSDPLVAVERHVLD